MFKVSILRAVHALSDELTEFLGLRSGRWSRNPSLIPEIRMNNLYSFDT